MYYPPVVVSLNAEERRSFLSIRGIWWHPTADRHHVLPRLTRNFEIFWGDIFTSMFAHLSDGRPLTFRARKMVKPKISPAFRASRPPPFQRPLISPTSGCLSPLSENRHQCDLCPRPFPVRCSRVHPSGDSRLRAGMIQGIVSLSLSPRFTPPPGYEMVMHPKRIPSVQTVSMPCLMSLFKNFMNTHSSMAF